MKTIIIAAMAMVAALTAGLGAQGSSPIVITGDEHMTVSMTLRDHIKESDAVVMVRMVGEVQPIVLDVFEQRRVREPSFKDVMLDVATAYEAQVLSVMKADVRADAVNTTIKIARPGGEGQWQGVSVIHKTEFPPIAVGKEYVLFLKYSEAVGALLFHSYDIFEVANGRLVANRFSTENKYGAELDGRTVQDATALTENVLNSIVK